MALLLEPLWFFSVYSVFILLLLLMCEAKENGVGAFILFALALGGVQVYLSKAMGRSLVPIVLDNLNFVLWCIAGYMIAGVVWAIFKWYLFSLERVEYYRDQKAKWFKENAHVINAESVEKEWQNYIAQRASIYVDFPPKVSNHKARITHWMSCWFTSLIWTFLSDFVTKFFRYITDFLSGFLQKISNHAFAKHLEELDTVNAIDDGRYYGHKKNSRRRTGGDR